LIEVTARLGSIVPYRNASELLAEFLPVEPTEGGMTVWHRTLTGWRTPGGTIAPAGAGHSANDMRT